MLLPNAPNDQYDFAAQPRAVKARTKFREAPQIVQEDVNNKNGTNIMFDKRVVRGNTHAAVFTTYRETGQQTKPAVGKPKKGVSKGTEMNELQAVPGDISTPKPREGFTHVDVQTDENIELLTDKPPEYEKDAQTDFYIDRPVNRLFVPRKIGEDKETQIEEGELFDFDYEVEPILQVLVGKIFEQARMEVLEEEELRIMKDEQKRYDEIRYAELVEAQRLEAFERRQLEETERRKKQYGLRNEQSILSHKKLVSRVLAKEYLRSLRNNAYSLLEDQGVFRTDFSVQLDRDYVPNLFDNTLSRLSTRARAESLLTSLIQNVMQDMAAAHDQARENERLRKIKAVEDKIREKEERARLKREREEEKKREEERRRLEELKTSIYDNITARGEQKEKVYNQVLSDIDSNGKEGNTVALLGGLLGEIMILLSTIEDLKNDESSQQHYTTVVFVEENLEKWLLNILKDLTKEGTVEIGIDPQFLLRLAEIDPNLTLENLNSNKAKLEQISDLLQVVIKSATINFMLANDEKLSISRDIFDMIVKCLAKILMTEEEGKKLRLVVAPQDYQSGPRPVAFASLMPNIDDLPQFDIQHAKSKKGKKAFARRESKSSAKSSKISEVTLEQSDAPQEEEQKIDAAEVDYEDKITLFSNTVDAGKVLVNHKCASIALRRDMLLLLSRVYAEVDNNEITILKRANQKAQTIETSYLETFEKIPVFNFELQ